MYYRSRLLLMTVFVAITTASGADLIWQLGVADDSDQEFAITYRPWEYGRTLRLPDTPGFDAAAGNFRYQVTAPGITERPPMVSGIGAENFKKWMPSNEVVHSLTLEWEEKAAEGRRITFHTNRFRNMGDGTCALELRLPDGQRELLSIPTSLRETGKDLALSSAFEVKHGRNSLTLRVLSRNKHFQLGFDRITLQNETGVIAPSSPNAETAFSNTDYTFSPGENGTLDFIFWNTPESGEVSCVISDACGGRVAGRTAKISNRRASISLPTAERGYFRVEWRHSGGLCGETAYVVLEPATLEYVENSRFGFHALSSQPIIWEEEAERKIRRAWRAGAKWARSAILGWPYLQPEPNGPFLWEKFDRRLAILEKYKIRTLLITGFTPKWASPTSSERLVSPIGIKEYQLHPPAAEAWGKYISALAVHCSKRGVKYYEIWNEPAYHSCFWLSGSPKEYALLLKTAYDAARKADPQSRLVVGGMVEAQGFLSETLAANDGKPYFDVLAFHYTLRSRSYRRWREVLRNEPDMPMFNTEESWWRSDDPLEFAAKLVRGYVTEAANGVSKTFGFHIFGEAGDSDHYGTVAADGTPMPAYAAFRTMTHRLEQADYAGALTANSDPLKLHLFLRGNTPVLVGWSESQTSVKTELSPGIAQVTVIDLMDRERSVKTEAGKLTLTFTGLPQFIEGGDPVFLLSLAKLVAGLPGRFDVKSGKTLEQHFSVALPAGNRLKLTPPAGWQGTLQTAAPGRYLLTLTAPDKAEPGNYIAQIQLISDNNVTAISLRVAVDGTDSVGNLVRNGNFAMKTKDKVPLFWYKGVKGELTAIPGGGVDGGTAWRAVNTGSGGVYWGPVGKVKVSPGEDYLIAITAKGDDGSFGVMYSITDANGKCLVPKRPGINLLNSRTTPEWGRYFDVIRISNPDAAYLSFALLVNHAMPGGVTFDNIALYLLNDRYPLAKRLWQGGCILPKRPVAIDGDLSDWKDVPTMTADRRDQVVLPGEKIKWKDENDLSATCQLMRDHAFLYLAITVKDDRTLPGKPQNTAWQSDSVQLALDPHMEGQDYSDLVFAVTPEGRPVVWRYHKFWTPELLTGVTSGGELKSAQLAVRDVPGGRIYEAKIPLLELHPLTAKTQEFGFSYLVNDDDGEGRKYIEWASGIGGRKSAKQFGLVRCETERNSSSCSQEAL